MSTFSRAIPSIHIALASQDLALAHWRVVGDFECHFLLLLYSQLGIEIPSNARWLLGNITHFHRFLGNLSTRTLHSLAGLFYVPNVSLAAAL